METNTTVNYTNVRGAAQRLGVSVSKMQQIVHSCGFPAARFGRRIVIPCDALDEWMREQAAQGLTDNKRKRG